jgi:hypothetical protein
MTEKAEGKYEANKGDWDADFSKEKKPHNENKMTWMKFSEPRSYRVRLVGPFVKFLRHNTPPFALKDRVITHESYKGEDPAWKAGFYPRTCYAIHVFDRDDKKLKILEKGTSVFKVFASYKKANDMNPSGKEAPDFQIDVEWPNGNKRQAKYTVFPLQKITPITPEEKDIWESQKAPLREIYKSTPLEKIVDLWDALPPSERIPKKRDDDSPTQSQNDVAEKEEIKEPIQAIEEVADSDDIFGDSDDGETF